jgi:hypothetical protein
MPTQIKTPLSRQTMHFRCQGVHHLESGGKRRANSCGSGFRHLISPDLGNVKISRFKSTQQAQTKNNITNIDFSQF